MSEWVIVQRVSVLFGDVDALSQKFQEFSIENYSSIWPGDQTLETAKWSVLFALSEPSAYILVFHHGYH